MALLIVANSKLVQPKPLRVLPFGRNKDFVGRQSHLNRLITILHTEGTEEDCQRVALVGLGGVGKTQIALECAFQLQKILPALSVFWVRASDTTSFNNTFREIGQQLKIPGLENNDVDVKTLVKTRLSQESTGKWLMIVDNADDFEIFYPKDNASGSGALSKHLPFSTLGMILFTTRDREAATKYAGSNIIDIDEMDDIESRELLQRSLQNKQLIKDEESMAKLIKSLVNLPLAIMQAAVYLNAKGCTIAEYLKIYEESSDNVIKLLSKDFEDVRRYPDRMKNPVATTWLISFQQVQNRDPLAADYMAFMSCIKEQDIPRDLLPPASEFDKTEALGTLKAFGFIKERVSGESYDMHRLVHTAMQNWLKLEDEWESQNHKTLKQISNTFPWPKHENRVVWMMYLPHAQSTITTFNMGLGRTEQTKELLWRLLYSLGACFQIKGQYAEAEAMYRQTLQLLETVLRKDHLNTLASMMNLAESLRQQGKYVEAEGICQQTLQLQETVLGKDHPDTLSSMNNLASLFYSQGMYVEAETIYRKTLQLQETLFGKNHPNTLTSMMNLAESLRQQGKYVEAEGICQQTLQLQETVLGKDHPGTLAGMNNLASLFYSQGKYVEAETIYRKTLQLQETVLGKNHPSTLRSTMSLAESLRQQGKYVEAEGICQQTLQLQETVLGKDHPDTLASMNNLASLFYSQGKYAEAETIYRKTLQLQETVLGKNHPSTLMSMMSLAESLRQLSKYVEAEGICQQTLQLKETVLGKDHPGTLASMNNLALLFYSQGKYAEAETIYRQTLQLQETVLGKDHPDTLMSMMGLAQSLHQQGKYAEAEAIRQRTDLKSEHPQDLNNVDSVIKAQDNPK